MESNLARIRREVYVRIAKAFFEGNLSEEINRIPLQMRPKNFGEATRCCIYKDRAMIKYRAMAALGLSIEDEIDELTPLSDYAKIALDTDVNNSHLTILTELCSGCVKTHYHITDACQGCVARPCTSTCAKGAISIVDGKAKIDPSKCVNCGRCLTVCPYQSIIRVPIPCEEACPVGAITKDETGKEKIDEEKCILCGKCLTACPFGAIAERSQLLKVIQAIKENKNITALIAPSITGQFPGNMEQLHRALLLLGFTNVLEVAYGAELTAIEETKEFMERMKEGKQFMTSSCCPAYVLAVKKHLNKLEEYVSTTPSPMIFTGKLAKEKYPETITVFIGPCLAKRSEAFNSEYIDYTLTFEELGTLFIAKQIDVLKCEPLAWEKHAAKEARLFAATGGVAGAIGGCISEDIQFLPFVVNGYDKKELKQLTGKLINQNPGNFIEVMTCEGGCIAGPCTIAKPNIALRSVETFAKKGESLPTLQEIEI